MDSDEKEFSRRMGYDPDAEAIAAEKSAKNIARVTKGAFVLGGFVGFQGLDSMLERLQPLNICGHVCRSTHSALHGLASTELEAISGGEYGDLALYRLGVALAVAGVTYGVLQVGRAFLAANKNQI